MFEHQHQKVVNITFVVFSVLVAFLILIGFLKVSNLYDLESKVKSIEYVIRAASILIGGLTFFILHKNAKVNLFMNEVASELMTKVTWPSSKDTVSATVVVLITVALAGIVVALFDWIFTLGLQSLWSGTHKWFS